MATVERSAWLATVDYGRLTAAAIVDALPGLSDPELEEVQSLERWGKGRVTVLRGIGTVRRRRATAGGGTQARPAAPAVRRPPVVATPTEEDVAASPAPPFAAAWAERGAAWSPAAPAAADRPRRSVALAALITGVVVVGLILFAIAGPRSSPLHLGGGKSAAPTAVKPISLASPATTAPPAITAPPATTAPPAAAQPKPATTVPAAAPRPTPTIAAPAVPAHPVAVAKAPAAAPTLRYSQEMAVRVPAFVQAAGPVTVARMGEAFCANLDQNVPITQAGIQLLTGSGVAGITPTDLGAVMVTAVDSLCTSHLPEFQQWLVTTAKAQGLTP